MKNQNNRARRVARKISDVLQKSRTLQQRFDAVNRDDELTVEEQIQALEALKNINASLQEQLHSLQKRQSSLPALPVTPTTDRNRNFVPETIFRTTDLEGRRIKMLKSERSCARAFLVVANSR